MSDQREQSQRGEPARFSTGWRAGTARPGVGAHSHSQATSSALSANQWAALVCLGVVLFIGVTLAAGVLVGRALRRPMAARAATSVPVSAAASIDLAARPTTPGLRVDPRPRSSIRDAGVPVLLTSELSTGDGAPAFRLEALGGGPLSLEDVRGQAVLVNFWATWCTWCKYELPALQAVYEKYRGRGLVVIGVDVEEPRSLVEAYAERYGLTYPIVLDEAGATAEVYGVRGLPMTFFIDGDGAIVRVQRGAMREDELELYVRGLLQAD